MRYYFCHAVDHFIHIVSNEKGFTITGAIITGAVIGGGASIAAGAIASSGAQQAAETAAESQQQALSAQQSAAQEELRRRDEAVAAMRAARENITYPTYLSIPEAQQYRQTLEDRMAGRGLIDVNALTAPVANQVRAGLRQTETAIGSAASARGLGRSTIATSQIGAASQAAERDIAERVAQLEITRQQQIGQAVSQFGTLSEQEAASQQNRALFEAGEEFSIAQTMAGNAAAATQNQFSIAQAIQAQGASQAAYQLQQTEIWSSALQGLSLSASQTSQDIIDAIEREQEQRRTGAGVNIYLG